MIPKHMIRKVGLSHRISLLFFCCVILPLAVIIGLLFYYLENELKDQGIQRLSHQAKNISMAIYERLLLAESEMRIFLPRDSSPLQEERKLLRSSDAPFQPRSLESLIRLGPKNAVPLFGSKPHFCGSNSAN